MTSKQVTSPSPWNSRRLIHSKEMVWASRWSVALRTLYRQVLSLLYSSFFFWNFRPRLARELLVLNIEYNPIRVLVNGLLIFGIRFGSSNPAFGVQKSWLLQWKPCWEGLLIAAYLLPNQRLGHIELIKTDWKWRKGNLAWFKLGISRRLLPRSKVTKLSS